MAERENLCTGCANNCCDHFRLYWPREEVAKLIETYPFLKVLGTDVGMVGNQERVYREMACERLGEDGSCRDYPDNRPPFCEKTGVESRPAVVCRFNDAYGKR